MIIDVNTRIAPTWWTHIEKLIDEFSLPVWLFYESDTAISGNPHQWHAKYKPSANDLNILRSVQPERGVRQLIRAAPSLQVEWVTPAADPDGG